MTETLPIHDEDLTAYLDGELDPARCEAVEAALERDHALRRRLDGLRIPREGMAQAFDRLAATAPSMPDLPSPRRETGGSVRRYAAMAACLLIGAAGGGLWATTLPERDSWMDYVAAYQALYVDATLASVVQPEAEGTEQLRRLGAVLGRDLLAAQDVDPLDFKRAQVLGYQGRPLIQIAYLSPEGAPVALCVIRSGEAADSGVRTARLEGMSSAWWSRNGFSYLLIGGEDDDLIARTASRLAVSL